MSKLVLAVVLAVLVCQGSSKPLVQDGDIAMKASAGDWDGVQKIIQQYVSKLGTPPPQLLANSGTYGSLQANGPSYTPTPGGNTPQGRYYSQSEYSYQRANNNNGVVTQDKGGLGMINDNGRISYYKPDPSSYAQLAQIPNTGYNFGAAPYGQGR